MSTDEVSAANVVDVHTGTLSEAIRDLRGWFDVEEKQIDPNLDAYLTALDGLLMNLVNEAQSLSDRVLDLEYQVRALGA